MQADFKAILFGGSFDPIHTGHVCVAQHAMRTLDAASLFFIPARRSPHKVDFPTPGQHRLAMIERAIEGIEGFAVCDCELSRPEPSYTLDTVRFFRDRLGPDAVLHWLIGADQLSDLENWYCIEELLKECRVGVMVRAGYPLPDLGRFKNIFSGDIIEQLKRDSIQTPLIDLNSTAIRQQLAAGTLPPDALPSAVLEYIQQHHLYGC